MFRNRFLNNQNLQSICQGAGKTIIMHLRENFYFPLKMAKFIKEMTHERNNGDLRHWLIAKALFLKRGENK